MQAIIYKNETNGVSIIWPMREFLEKLGIGEIALKDVPYGKPFKIVNVEDLPTDGTLNEQGVSNIDKTLRNQWEADEIDLTDGTGLGANRWFINELEKELIALNATEYPAAQAKGDNPNPDEMPENEFEAMYQAYLVQHMLAGQAWAEDKEKEITRIESQIATLQAEIAKEK
jgi:hypothetical protein